MNDVNKGTPVELASGLEIKLEREVVKEALKEGIWGMTALPVRAIGVALFGAVVWFILWAGGWHSPLSK